MVDYTSTYLWLPNIERIFKWDYLWLLSFLI